MSGPPVRGVYFYCAFAFFAGTTRDGPNGLAAKSASETPVMPTNRAATTRRLKKADFEVDFFLTVELSFLPPPSCILDGGSGGDEEPSGGGESPPPLLDPFFDRRVNEKYARQKPNVNLPSFFPVTPSHLLLS